MFFSCKDITSIKFVNVDTTDIKEMIYAFSDLHLKSLDLSCFISKNVKNIFNCFFGSQIEEANLSNFNFDDITDFGAFFGRGWCLKLILSKRYNKGEIGEFFSSIKNIKIVYI